MFEKREKIQRKIQVKTENLDRRTYFSMRLDVFGGTTG